MHKFDPNSQNTPAGDVSSLALQEKWNEAAATRAADKTAENPPVITEDKEKIYTLPPRAFHSSHNGIPYDINAGMPVSLRLMGDMIIDLIYMHGAPLDEVYYEYVHSENSKEHILDFVHVRDGKKTSMNYPDAQEENFDINETFYNAVLDTLAGLDTQNHQNTLRIEREKLCLSVVNKTDLFNVLEDYVEEIGLSTLNSQAMSTRFTKTYKQQGGTKRQWLRERTTRFSEEALTQEKTNDVYRYVHLVAVPVRPYPSMEHYRTAAMISQSANLLHDFEHISKVIDYEDGTIETPALAREYVIGGYN